LKKLVVVVDAFREVPKKEIFEGENLKVGSPTQSGSINIPILTVSDGDKTIAEFKKWHYWTKIK